MRIYVKDIEMGLVIKFYCVILAGMVLTLCSRSVVRQRSFMIYGESFILFSYTHVYVPGYVIVVTQKSLTIISIVCAWYL